MRDVPQMSMDLHNTHCVVSTNNEHVKVDTDNEHVNGTLIVWSEETRCDNRIRIDKGTIPKTMTL
jgi:hypothetical protein